MKNISVGFKDGEKTTDEILARYPQALEIRKIQPHQHQKLLDDWEKLVDLIDGQATALAPYELAVENCPPGDRLSMMLQRDSVQTKIQSCIRSGLQRFEVALATAQVDYDTNQEYKARDYHFAVA